MTVSPLAVPMIALAVLLGVAGAQKVLDPTMTVGALRAMRLPSAPTLVRLGSAVEVGLAVGVLVVGGALLWSLVSLSFVAFGLFVLAAMRQGTMVATCGCFGRDETPPHWIHVAANGVLASVAGAAAVWYPEPLVDVLADHPGDALVLSAAAALLTYLIYALMVELPRTRAAAGLFRPS